MRIRVKGTGTPSAAEFIKPLLQFFFDPFEIDLDQCDEVKVCMEHFSKVLFGIITIVRDNFCLGDAKCLQLLQGVFL